MDENASPAGSAPLGRILSASGWHKEREARHKRSPGSLSGNEASPKGRHNPFDFAQGRLRAGREIAEVNLHFTERAARDKRSPARECGGRGEHEGGVRQDGTKSAERDTMVAQDATGPRPTRWRGLGLSPGSEVDSAGRVLCRP